jgi:hypothetical protein
VLGDEFIVPSLDFRKHGLLASGRSERTSLSADTAGMAEKPEPPPELTAGSVHKIAKKAAWLGIVEAPDEATAIEKASAEFKVPASTTES